MLKVFATIISLIIAIALMVVAVRKAIQAKGPKGVKKRMPIVQKAFHKMQFNHMKHLSAW